MKALTLIPKKIKKDYEITRRNNAINIHTPVYVNIDFDKSFEISQGLCTLSISNDKCVVSLWKSVYKMHITIF